MCNRNAKLYILIKLHALVFECIRERTVVVTDLPTHKHTQPQTDRTDYNTLHSSYHAV